MVDSTDNIDIVGTVSSRGCFFGVAVDIFIMAVTGVLGIFVVAGGIFVVAFHMFVIVVDVFVMAVDVLVMAFYILVAAFHIFVVAQRIY